MTVDGFGFGTLTGESCLKNVHCHTDRASWGAILVTVVAFGALMWEKCAQSHSFGLGRVGGGGIPLGGGGRRTENRDHIYIYIFFFSGTEGTVFTDSLKARAPSHPVDSQGLTAHRVWPSGGLMCF